MKTTTFLLLIALIALTMAGCVEDKPAPRLDSPDRNERLKAVREARNKYGTPAPPPAPATDPAQTPKTAMLPAQPLSGDVPVADRQAIVGRWNHPWGGGVYCQFAADGTYTENTLLFTFKGTWSLPSPGTILCRFLGFFGTYEVQQYKYRLHGDTLELDSGFGWVAYVKAR